MARITFRREPSERGLASVTQGTRGWHVNVDGERVGTVAVRAKVWDMSSRYAGPDEPRWYWYARIGTESSNTASENQSLTADEAKKQCRAWVRQQLSR
jgi:hypothetical protein